MAVDIWAAEAFDGPQQDALAPVSEALDSPQQGAAGLTPEAMVPVLATFA
jgi:hypothetical protein